MVTIVSESGYARGLNSTASTTEKIAVFAPMPTASVRTTTAANPGARAEPTQGAGPSDLDQVPMSLLENILDDVERL